MSWLWIGRRGKRRNKIGGEGFSCIGCFEMWFLVEVDVLKTGRWFLGWDFPLPSKRACP
jgi:hypothetical protein